MAEPGGLRRTPEDQIGSLARLPGLAGRRKPARHQRLRRKPPRLRPDQPACARFPEGEYLTLFGQYIVKPKLFDYLKEHIENNVREHGEFQLTSPRPLAPGGRFHGPGDEWQTL